MKKYQVIYADPPWKYENSPMGDSNRSIENHYKTMTLEEIKKLPIENIKDENSVLFLWTTAPKLKEGLEVMKEWGFEYRTCTIWDKVLIGLGYWFRNQHEILLIGLCGKFSSPNFHLRPSSIYREQRREHSAKPTYFRDLIAKWYPDKNKIELFARPNNQLKLDGTNTFDNWDVWGNEIESNITL